MNTATQEQREVVRRAIGAVFSHLSKSQIETITAKHDALAYAGMQLGTSSQAKATGEYWDAIGETVDDISEFYVIDIAEFISG